MDLTLYHHETGEVVQSGTMLQVVSAVGGDLAALMPLYGQIRERAANTDRADWVFLAQQLGRGFRVNRAHKVFHQFAAADMVIMRIRQIEDEYTDALRRRPNRKQQLDDALERARAQIWLDAAQAFGLRTRTVMNMVDVAEAYPDEERKFVLPFGHYDELRSEDSDLRQELLFKAESATPKWTREQLRAERARLRQANGQKSTTQDPPKTHVNAALAEMLDSIERDEPHDEAEDGDYDYDNFPPPTPQESPARALRRLAERLDVMSSKFMRGYFTMAKATGEPQRMKIAMTRAQAFTDNITKLRRHIEEVADRLNETNEGDVIDGYIVNADG